MARNEIRLRRQMMSSGRIAHHRNYGELMARHEKELKIKRIIRVFIYFLVIVFIIILIFIFRSIQEKKFASPKQQESALVIKSVEQSV